jgi:hypothetical protein
MKDRTRLGNLSRSTHLALVPAEAVLIELGLGTLSPLLLWLTTTTIPSGALGHLLVRLSHSRAAEAGLGLRSEGLSTGAWAYPRISLLLTVPKLLLMPLTLG